MLGKYVDDLQDEIEIDGEEITGTLKYVDGYTGFSGDPEEQYGNYLALHFEAPEAEDATITVELINGTVGHPVTLDPDGLIVIRITDKNTQIVEVVASLEGYESVTKRYSLAGLTLEPAPDNAAEL